MIGFVLALSTGWGTFLLYTAVAMGWKGYGVSPRPSGGTASRRAASAWLVQAGLGDVRPAEFVAVEAAFVVGASALTWVLVAAPVPSLFAGLLVGAAPVALYRGRRRKLQEEAREAWPHLIEEIRLLTGSMGRSIPLALLEAGRKSTTAPMQAAFGQAQREWLISTDFARTTEVLKARLADPTADATCETLLVAHEVGGADLDRRLGALLDDRSADLQDRKDARSRQAGVRFARWFVLAVPIGMALCGLSIGNGRAAYQTAGGQVAVLVAVGLTAVCWVWASRIMRLPDPQRVFDTGSTAMARGFDSPRGAST